MALCTYVGGLPMGHPKELLRVEIKGGAVHLRHPGLNMLPIGGWDYNLPLSAITGREIVDQTRVSAMRVLTAGILALAWKKHDRFLLLHYTISGVTSTCVLGGAERALRDIDQQLLRAQLAAANGTPAASRSFLSTMVFALPRLAWWLVKVIVYWVLVFWWFRPVRAILRRRRASRVPA